MQQLRFLHRMVTVPIVIFTLFLAITGVAIQLIDLDVILTHAPADNVNVRSMREAFDGPGAFQVRHTQDYLAPSLPSGFDYRRALARALPVMRKAADGAPLTFVEFRMEGARPAVWAQVGKGHVAVASDMLTARTDMDEVESQSPTSDRNTWKHLHRMTTFGNGALVINVLVSLGLVVLIVTGLWIYVKLAKQRRRIRKPILYWSAGGTWRSLHRVVSLVSALWLVVVTLSGGWLAVESLGLAVNMAMHAGGPRMGPSTPAALSDAELPIMLEATLAAAGRDAPGEAVKVLRLRHYGPYRQGVVVTAGEEASRQLVYNTATGEGMSESEAGYPPVPFPFGWQAHQTAKAIHRGSWFGMTGRWMDLLAGAAMAYLSVSGIVMYVTMWRKRAEGGRRALFWK